MPQTARWIVTFAFTEEVEPIQATVYSCALDERRNVLRHILGPFEDPTEILQQVMEILDQAWWRGTQLSFAGLEPNPEEEESERHQDAGADLK